MNDNMNYELANGQTETRKLSLVGINAGVISV